MLFTDLRDAVYDWIAPLVAPAPVVWGHQNNPRPAKPYVLAIITPSRAVGQDYVSPPDNNGIATVLGNREFTLMLQYVGAGGYDALERVRTSLEMPTVLQSLHADDIASVRVEDMQDISALADSRYEDRYMLDATMRVENYCTDAVGLIETVAVQTYYTDATHTIKTDLVTITLN